VPTGDASVALLVFSALVTAFFVVYNASQLAMGAVAAVVLWRYQQRRTRRNRALVDHLAAPPLVSIVMPALNEESTIVESVRAILALEYESREIVVVNDGSADRTLALLCETFRMLPAPLAFDQPLASGAAARCVIDRPPSRVSSSSTKRMAAARPTRPMRASMPHRARWCW